MIIFPKRMPMKAKSAIITIILSLCWVFTFGQINQQVADSLLALSTSKDKAIKVDALISLTRLVWDYYPDSAFYYANLAIQAADKTNNNDILGDAYNNQANAFLMNQKYGEALAWYGKAIDFRKKGTSPIKVAHTLHNIGQCYRNLNSYSESINAYKEAADISAEVGNNQNQAYMLMNVAINYERINDNNKALEYAIQAASIFIQIDVKPGVAYTYNFIGSLHRDLGNINLALEYHLKAYQIYESLGDEIGLTTSSNNLGIVYDELNDNPKALEYYIKSLDLAINSDDKEGQAVAYNNIGYLRSKMKNYTEALVAYEKSLEISEELKNLSSIMNTYNNIAWVYFHSGDIANSYKFVQKALTYSEHNRNLLYLAESNEILSRIAYKRGEYKKGFDYLSNFMSIKDSLFKAINNEKFMEMQVRFETERKEQEIELLKKGDEIKNLEIKRQKNLNVFWIVISILLVSSGIVIAFNLKSKQKVNQLLTEKNSELEEINKKLTESEQHLKELNITKDRFFSLIAHDLKNPFNALMGFSELLFSNYPSYSDEEKIELVKIIYDSSQNLYKLLDNLLQWSRSQLGSIMYNPELLPLLPIVDDELDLLKPIANNKGLKISVQIEEYLIVFADKNLVGVIIRNLVSNAIKFSNANDIIEITAIEEDNMVKVSVADTGIGIDKNNQDKLFRLDTNFTSKGTADEKGTGLGLLLCKEFVEKNGGDIWLEDNDQKGSKFIFTLPSIRSSRSAEKQ
jgi:signal transduction histidine kinase